MESKGWNWNEVTDEWWKIPADEVYPIMIRWKNLNKKDFLDLGCGIGRHAKLFEEERFNVSAFDISDAGIEKLNKEISERELKVNATVGDMIELPYKDNTFDCILAFHVIYHTDRIGIRKTISEIERVLKKDGEIFITFNSVMNPSYSDSSNQIIDKYTRVKTEGIEKGIPHYFVDEQEIKLLLKDFKIIKLQQIENIYADRRSWHYFVLAKKL